jgi:hypothetical protein
LSKSLSLEAEHAVEHAKQGAKFTARVAMRLLFLYASIGVLMVASAYAFRSFELQQEKESAGELRAQIAEAMEILQSHNLTSDELATVTGVMSTASDCGLPDKYSENDSISCNWDWNGALYFAFTIMTSIGYNT